LPCSNPFFMASAARNILKYCSPRCIRLQGLLSIVLICSAALRPIYRAGREECCW